MRVAHRALVLARSPFFGIVFSKAARRLFRRTRLLAGRGTYRPVARTEAAVTGADFERWTLASLTSAWSQVASERATVALTEFEVRHLGGCNRVECNGFGEIS